jgi:hypothetical protein
MLLVSIWCISVSIIVIHTYIDSAMGESIPTSTLAAAALRFMCEPAARGAADCADGVDGCAACGCLSGPTAEPYTRNADLCIDGWIAPRGMVVT